MSKGIHIPFHSLTVLSGRADISPILQRQKQFTFLGVRFFGRIENHGTTALQMLGCDFKGHLQPPDLFFAGSSLRCFASSCLDPCKLFTLIVFLVQHTNQDLTKCWSSTGLVRKEGPSAPHTLSLISALGPSSQEPP